MISREAMSKLFPNTSSMVVFVAYMLMFVAQVRCLNFETHELKKQTKKLQISLNLYILDFFGVTFFLLF